MSQHWTQEDIDPTTTTRTASRKRARSLGGGARVAIAKSTTRKDVNQDKKIAYLMRTVKSLRPEMKQTTLVLNHTPSYTGVLGAVIGGSVSQGTGDSNQRIGDTISLYDIQGMFHLGNTSTSAPYTARILIVLDYDNEIISASEIIHSIGNSAAPDAMYTFDYYGKKYKLLWDKRISVGPGNTNPAGVVSFYHKFKVPYKTTFSNSTSTPVKNEIRYLVINDQATSTFVLTGNIRVRYTDA